ncbi:MAG: hypothetical protein U1F43_36625 [Myxococcota bacterium]
MPRICPAPPGSHGCSIATCDPRDGCGLRQGTGPCDDGDLCTSDEQCVDGACRGGLLVVCDDGDPCTDDACDPASGCTSDADQAPRRRRRRLHRPRPPPRRRLHGGPCDRLLRGRERLRDDLDPCTVDGCERGTARTRRVCDDHNPCTFDTCAGAPAAPSRRRPCRAPWTAGSCSRASSPHSTAAGR